MPPEENSAQENINPQENKEVPQEFVQPEETLVDLAKVKKAEIKKKKKTFDKIILGLKFLLIFIVLGVGAYFVLQKPEDTVVPKFIIEEPNVEPDDETDSEWNLYKDEGLKIFIKHPQEATVIKSEETNKLEVVFEKDSQDPNIITEKSLNQGYIFRVSPLNIALKDLDKITKIKLDSFKSKCPETASFGDISKTLLDTVAARNFTVSNCDVDYEVTYSPRFGIYYEILQIYKGDLGIKQQYKSITDEILLSFRYFPEDDETIIEPFQTYINERDKFLFKHPNFDSECCDFPKPTSQGNPVKIIVLGEKETFADKDNFNGFAVFVEKIGKEGYDSYLSIQKQSLKEDYSIVTGNQPITEDLNIKLGELEGALLKGYSWRGYNMIYLKLPRTEKALILTIKNTTGEKFDETMRKVYESFEFF